MQEKDTVLEVKNLYKLFGPYDFLDERKAAFKLLELGASRMDVMETTGIMAAISDVSFSVKRGELFVLIGLSGSGKSTIVRCLNMLHKPTNGTACCSVIVYVFNRRGGQRTLPNIMKNSCRS